nr:MAG TPA: hypothetical protein [Caudoviricetes sp.]
MNSIHLLEELIIMFKKIVLDVKEQEKKNI